MLQNNPELRSLIDQLWNKFWSGGISKPKAESDRRQKHFFVPYKGKDGETGIVDEDYDLSFSRYKIDVFEEIKYEAPSVILDKLIKAEVGEASDNDLAKIKSGIVKELLELRDMIG